MIMRRCRRTERPSPGFTRFGLRRQYSKKGGFRRSIVLNSGEANAAGPGSGGSGGFAGRLRRSFVSVALNEPVDEEEDNLAPLESEDEEGFDEEFTNKGSPKDEKKAEEEEYGTII